MSIFSKISNLSKLKENDNIESEITQRIQLLNFTILLLLVITFLFGVVHLISSNLVDCIVIFSFFILFLTSFFILRKTSNYILSVSISLILITLLFMYLIFAGVGNNTSILWGICYPILLSLTIDIKRSGFISILFLIVTISAFIISSYIDSLPNYSNDLIIRYSSIYLIILVMLQFFLRLKQQVLNLKEKKTIETQQELTEKNNFLSNISYQIRTPLNNIAGIINLQRDKMDEEIVEEIELSVSNLISIVNSIPEVFEKDVIRIKGEKTYFNVNSIIKKSINLFQSDKYKNLKCTLNLSGKIPQNVFGDRLVLMQILMSVIDFCYQNSAKKTTKIEIISLERIAGDKNYVVIKIKSDLDKIEGGNKSKDSLMFEKSKDKEIRMIKELTKSISGDLSFISEEGTISFLFTLDFQKEGLVTEIEKQEKTQTSEIFKESKKIKLKDSSILLVEDDIMNSKVMTLNLDKHVNKIIMAVNGKEALEKYASTKIDLILMDIRMPLMDGFKTTEKIREAEMGTDSQTPIIAVTANVSTEMKKKCFEVGMNDFTTKPINFKILIKKMEALLS